MTGNSEATILPKWVRSCSNHQTFQVHVGVNGLNRIPVMPDQDCGAAFAIPSLEVQAVLPAVLKHPVEIPFQGTNNQCGGTAFQVTPQLNQRGPLFQSKQPLHDVVERLLPKRLERVRAALAGDDAGNAAGDFRRAVEVAQRVEPDAILRESRMEMDKPTGLTGQPTGAFCTFLQVFVTFGSMTMTASPRNTACVTKISNSRVFPAPVVPTIKVWPAVWLMG